LAPVKSGQKGRLDASDYIEIAAGRYRIGFPCMCGGRLSRILGMMTILLIVLILIIIGAIPTWPHSRSWGYGPSGGLGTILIILLILYLLHII
jgi:hypothetical protein